jgi:signal transduction histidine kinase
MMQEKGQRSEEENAGYFRILKENSSRMQELVNDLLLASRIEEGKLRSDRKEFSLPELVKDVAGEFAPWTQASNIKIVVEGESEIQRIVSDPSLVRQALENLVDNAVRYASQEKKEKRESVIIISYAKQDKNVRVEVQDNGLGIPAEDQKYIFQRFFRSRNVARQETHGSGLGLYIAKAMVKSLGGAIGFTSQEYKGSKFWFTIPITS